MFLPALKTMALLSLLLLLAALPAAKAWNFVVYPDSECESTASGEASGDGDSGCQDSPANHKSFEISNMGSCELFLFATATDCDDGNSEQFYDAGDENSCIPPDFQWDSYFFDC